MTKEMATPEDYIAQLPEERQEAVQKLRETIQAHLPHGFEEVMSYGMISYVIPHSLYPAGYHVNEDEPLTFISLASQKNYVAFYHMGVYAFPEILDWFKEEYKKRVPTKLDMGKACIRLKKMDQIPYELVGELCEKITPEEYIERYEAARK
ncbi:DUF1801 domain-containing protein [Atopococcus tabaci]|uniref:DUF1801 domain-containing protein n=1 Tax=Atopococcus tabaci TaxID=269774 RepID=UPI00240A65F1|nr:DUF1801 domain-containing protein [Atopococcus tabaci]